MFLLLLDLSAVPDSGTCLVEESNGRMEEVGPTCSFVLRLQLVDGDLQGSVVCACMAATLGPEKASMLLGKGSNRVQERDVPSTIFYPIGAFTQ